MMIKPGLVAGFLIGTLCACSVGETMPPRPRDASGNFAPALAATPDARTSAALIDFMNTLAALPADARSAAIDALIRDFIRAPSPNSMLALALTLQQFAPDEAQSRTLRTWLATEPAIPAPMHERLHERLDAADRERRSARAETARVRHVDLRESELAEQVRAARAEVADYRAQLARAEAKIRALTSIEEEIGRSGSNTAEPP